ncbi:MAG: hypothetical protein H6722_10360 [Sandaracinus sp.]|nr:hypothetical protein [Sandaracinus sp.]MCB9618177.1 hypothetical protein [Sandaracinus sp.]
MTPDELADAVSMHRARLLAAFRGEEPWEPVAESYGVTPTGAREAELRACLEAVATWGRDAASRLGPPGVGITAHLADLVRETMNEIAPAPTTGGKAGLAMIFANATASVSWWKERYGKVKTIYVARCRFCGGKQTTALAFHCPYCGRFLYADPKQA